MPLSQPFRASVLVALLVTLSSASQAQANRFPQLWSPDGLVEGMAVLGDTLFASGRFRTVGPPTGQLAVLDKTTGEAALNYPQFDAIGSGSPGITVVIPDGQGGYYVGGEFAAVSEQPRRNLARVLPDGTLDPDFRPDPALNPGTPGSVAGFVTTLALDRSAASPSGAGVLYVGGRFETVGRQPREDLAALDAATGAVLPIQAAFDQDNIIFGVRGLVVRDGVVYVGGEFSTVNGQPRTGLAAFDTATGVLLPWAPTLTEDNPVLEFPFASQLALGDSTLYVGGMFEAVDGQPRRGLAELTLADPTTGEGGVPTAWTPATGLNGFVVVGNFLWGQPSGR